MAWVSDSGLLCGRFPKHENRTQSWPRERRSAEAMHSCSGALPFLVRRLACLVCLCACDESFLSLTALAGGGIKTF